MAVMPSIYRAIKMGGSGIKHIWRGPGSWLLRRRRGTNAGLSLDQWWKDNAGLCALRAVPHSNRLVCTKGIFQLAHAVLVCSPISCPCLPAVHSGPAPGVRRWMQPQAATALSCHHCSRPKPDFHPLSPPPLFRPRLLLPTSHSGHSNRKRKNRGLCGAPLADTSVHSR